MKIISCNKRWSPQSLQKSIPNFILGLVCILAVASNSAIAQTCPCTLLGQQTPAVANAADNQAVELGVAFQSAQPGLVSAIRFYKGSRNTGAHVGSLWQANGTLLGRVTFSNETASGWQTATFSQAIAISANTLYVASYYAPQGNYSHNSFFFNQQLVNGPLSVPAGSSNLRGGVYRYGANGFPTNMFQATNYWVDVVFAPSASGNTGGGTPQPPTTPPTTPPPTTPPPTTPAPAIPAPSGPIRWPVEVIGAAGTVVERTFTLSNSPGNAQLSLKLHSYTYPNEGSVQVNNGPWIPLNSSTVTLQGLANAYGGIGGGFKTLNMTVNNAVTGLVNGANTIRFRFERSNGISSGFRVLRFNLVSGGNNLISNSNFVEDNPDTWTAPLNNSSDIAAGKTLWTSASLQDPRRGAIRAKCGSCHTQDGRDLKYFNYSNNVIRIRSQFHGLSQRQGDQVASYIRSLAVANPGRPWNPPYQPGPGLDSQPVENWSAGAGIDSVLENDADTLNYISVQDAAQTADLSVRETPIALQMPDWNGWLPSVHPLDAFGSNFENSSAYRDYSKIRSSLRYNNPDSVPLDDVKNWLPHFQNFLWSYTNNNPQWTPSFVENIYSLGLWPMVKNWEIANEFRLEGYGQQLFQSSQADSRAWFSALPFFASPNMQKIPWGADGLANGTPISTIYLAHIWYHMQLILNNSNKKQLGNSPIDWGYVYGFIKDLSVRGSRPQAGTISIWLVKALQILNNGKGPELGAEGGWMPHVADPSRLVHPDFLPMWSRVSVGQRVALIEAIVRAWFASVKQFSPQRFYQGGFANSSEVPSKSAYDGRFVDRVYFMIPQLRNAGVNAALMSQIADWAKTMWPRGNWDATKTAPCYTAGSSEVRCSTQD